MSRIGKNPVPVPAGVDVKLEGRDMNVKGKLGQLSMRFVDDVDVEMADGQITVKPVGNSKKARMMWGMQRTLAANLVQGVSEGFVRDLEITGVGYRAQVQGKVLNLSLGYSHDVLYDIPEGIEIKCEKPTSIRVSGIDKQRVGQVAAEIRAWRPPEPYKGKGVRYSDEYVVRKEGKKK
ncbi:MULTISPECIES: 50S ribosomal protein L6 [unclassified Minwuia]|jgi:large subunit ribosomal protein L6|uniref:50S ribosomal protein L6 n=1 Tax=unclassified Minwuia TaxID=2618799 RepID=UPI002479FC41|nr:MULTISPECIES: 50S ribosomal protein L6 [unclassified Minwuia]